MKLQRRRGRQRAVAPVARKLAMILHAIWRDGSEFRFGQAIVRCGNSPPFATRRTDKRLMSIHPTSKHRLASQIAAKTPLDLRRSF
jgi:hypothetical protein